MGLGSPSEHCASSADQLYSWNSYILKAAVREVMFEVYQHSCAHILLTACQPDWVVLRATSKPSQMHMIAMIFSGESGILYNWQSVKMGFNTNNYSEYVLNIWSLHQQYDVGIQHGRF